MAGRQRITMKQVAAEADVSVQTVSRVINQRPDVADETRQRIMAIVDRLGYQPSHVARSLIHGRSFTIGVVGYELELFGPSRVLSGIEQQTSELGYALLLSVMRQPQGDSLKMLRDMLAHQVDGIIWAAAEIGNNRDWTEELAQVSIPTVFLHTDHRPHLSVVDVDNRAGGRLATHHLIDCGYQQIGLITGPLEWWEARQRELGWRDALEAAGLPGCDALVAEGDWSPASGEQGLRRLLEQNPGLDAVFACNDQMALGALKVARERGLRVPEDLALVGFDDIPEAAYFWPPLTTVRQDLYELGRRAVGVLNRLIKDDTPFASQAIWLQPELIVRGSTIRRSAEETEHIGA